MTLPKLLQLARLVEIQKAELRLHEELTEQSALLQSVTEASASLSVWLRDSATAAAAAATAATGVESDATTDASAEVRYTSSASHPLHLNSRHRLAYHPGMCFYSLGELLRLTPSPTIQDTLTVEEPVVLAGEASAPWALKYSVLLPAPVTVLPTPVLLIRHRLFDPSPTALPPSHPLLLGSVEQRDFPHLLQWLHAFTQECHAALHRLQSRQRPAAAAAVAARVRHDDMNDVDGGSAIHSAAQSRQRRENEDWMLSQPRDDTLVEHASAAEKWGGRVGTKRPLEEASPSCVAGEGTAGRDGESCGVSCDGAAWASLCATLRRLFTFIAEITAPPRPPPTALASPWAGFWSTLLADSPSRALCRFLLAELGSLHDELQRTAKWCEAELTRLDYNDTHAPSTMRRQRPRCEVIGSPIALLSSTPPALPLSQQEGEDDGAARTLIATALQAVGHLVPLSARVYTQLKRLIPAPESQHGKG